MEIRECLKNVTESFKHELYGMKKLEGEKLRKFDELFYVDLEEDEEIYYNQFNICFTSGRVFDRMRPYLKEKSKVASIEIPEYDTCLHIYAYFNDQILTEYL